MSLKKELDKRLQQLENRKMMIPRYINQGNKFLGSNKYTPEMLAKVENQIEETKAAIKGIELWKNTKKQP